MAWCLLEWSLDPDRKEDDVLVMVGDNQPAIRSMHKGWSRNAEIMTEIDKVTDLIEKRLIIFVDIDTDHNYADIGTRPLLTYTKRDRKLRLDETWKRLNEGRESYCRTRCALFMRPISTMEAEDAIPSEPDESNDDEIDEVENETPDLKRHRRS